MSSITVGAHSRPTTSRWAPVRRALAGARATAADTARTATAYATNLRQAALTVTGLGFVDAAAYQVNNGVGLLVTGASVLVLEWLTHD